MKKLSFLLALGAIFVSSCKKTYTCTCTYTGGLGTGTTKIIIPDATKQQATDICLYREVYVQGGTQTTKCSL